jgi:hypothetical protein
MVLSVAAVTYELIAINHMLSSPQMLGKPSHSAHHSSVIIAQQIPKKILG